MALISRSVLVPKTLASSESIIRVHFHFSVHWGVARFFDFRGPLYKEDVAVWGRVARRRV